MTIKEEYMKKRKSIQNKVSYYKKKGIIINVKLPKIPKKITEKSFKAVSIPTESLLSKSKYIDIDTGELITKKAFLQKSKKQKSKTMFKPINVMVQYKEIFIYQIERFSERASRIVKWWLNKQIASLGEKETWSKIAKAANEGIFITEQELASSNTAYEALFSKLEQIANFMGLTGEEREIFSPTTDIDGADIYDSEGEYI